MLWIKLQYHNIGNIHIYSNEMNVHVNGYRDVIQKQQTLLAYREKSHTHDTNTLTLSIVKDSGANGQDTLFVEEKYRISFQFTGLFLLF